MYEGEVMTMTKEDKEKLNVTKKKKIVRTSKDCRKWVHSKKKSINTRRNIKKGYS